MAQRFRKGGSIYLLPWLNVTGQMARKYVADYLKFPYIETPTDVSKLQNGDNLQFVAASQQTSSIRLMFTQ